MTRISRVLAVGVVGVLAVVGSAVAQDKVLMRLNLEKGQVFTYQTVVTTEISGEKSKASELEMVYTLTVKKKLNKIFEVEYQISSASALGEQISFDHGIFGQITLKFDEKRNQKEPNLKPGNDDQLLPQLGGGFPVERIEVGSTWTTPFRWPTESRNGSAVMSYSVFERKKFKDWEVLEIRGQLENGNNEFRMSTSELVDVKSGMPVVAQITMDITYPELGVVRTTTVTRLLGVR
ncbi:hypothetical protein C0431_04545 [bacterium]|nr:hypothetical protein [bacterium]